MRTNTANLIIKYIQKRQQATPNELAGFLNISRQALHKQINRLLNSQQLIKAGKPPKVYYYVKTSEPSFIVSKTTKRAGLISVEEIRQKVNPILKQHGISRAAVFGSTARGDALPNSDIDVLVEIPRRYGLFEFMEIKNSLEDVLGKKVDLVEYKAIKPRVKDNILKDQVVIL